MASATSVYDNLLRAVDRLPLKTSSLDAGVDISEYWYQLIKGTSYSSCTSTVKNSLDSAMNTGNWGITLYTGDVGNANGADAHTETYVLVYWTDGPDGYNQFAGTSPNDYVQNTPGATPHREALIYIRDDDTPSTPIHVECTNNNFTIISSRPLGTPGLTWFSYDAQVYYSTFDTIYPSGYAGEPIPGGPPLATYVPMGDSFSGGHGNGPYEAGTDRANENECKRSIHAYPRLLQNSLNLGPTNFVACSGATTANVLYGGGAKGSWGEAPQISALSDATEMVTITIGGNDVAFEDYALGCVVICGPGTPVYVAMVAGINDDFKANLKTTFETILSEAPEAEVYVLDYAYMSSDDVPGCGPFDLSGARSVQQLLNTKISQAVVEINDPRLHFVPTNYPGSPFEGRHLCTSDPRGSAFDLFTMHPNASGLEAYKEVLTAYLN